MSLKTKGKDRAAKRNRQFQEAVEELFPQVDMEKLRGFIRGDWEDCISPALQRLLNITRAANDTEESVENIRVNQAVIFVLKYLFSVSAEAEKAIEKLDK